MSKTVRDSLKPSWRELRHRALSSGGEIKSINSILWDISGRCQKPVYREIKAVPGHGWHPDPVITYYTKAEYIDLHVPCRKCHNCLRARASLWRNRAKVEILLSSRTWMATYTVRPDDRVWFRAKASKRLGRRYTKAEEFAAICKEIGIEFTKYLKRIRKESGCKLRYIMVYESHKDGWPHLHALIHERGDPVRKELLARQWPHGFTTFKLCDAQAPIYVTKYLSKSMLARVRASLRYGSRSENIAAGDHPVMDDPGMRGYTTPPKRGKAQF